MLILYILIYLTKLKEKFHVILEFLIVKLLYLIIN